MTVDERLNTSIWDGDETGWTTVVSKKQKRAMAKKRAKKRVENEISETVPGWSANMSQS